MHLQIIRTGYIVQMILNRESAMIICNCNCLKERELMQACRPEMESAEDLYAALGCQLKCGRCVPYVQEIMMEQMGPAQLA